MQNYSSMILVFYKLNWIKVRQLNNDSKLIYAMKPIYKDPANNCAIISK